MAKKQAHSPPKFHIQGEFVKQTFLRLYKAQAKATDEQAQTKFQSLLKSGEIVFLRFSGLVGDVSVYKFKSA